MSSLTMLYLFHVHVIFSIFALFGLVLLYHWIVTALPLPTQRKVAVAVLLVSGVVIAITVPFCLAGMRLMVM